MKKIAIIGCGFLGNIIADAMKKGLLADYTLAGAMSHQKASAEKLCEGLGGEAVESLDELLALNPDMVIETASVAMVREACIPALEHGADFIPLSIGAFADAAFYQKAQEAARAHGVHIYIPHGAVGGFDVLLVLIAELDVPESVYNVLQIIAHFPVKNVSWSDVFGDHDNADVLFAARTQNGALHTHWARSGDPRLRRRQPQRRLRVGAARPHGRPQPPLLSALQRYPPPRVLRARRFPPRVAPQP